MYGFEYDNEPVCVNCNDTGFLASGEPCPYCEEIPTDEGDYDDSMDGDFDSAMASAGFGYDEQYDHFEDIGGDY
jgi:hypothetical protein